MENVSFWFRSSRAQAYLTWLLLVSLGFVATQFYQNLNINILWFVISVIGLGVMYKVMPLGVRQMKLILAAWAVPITFGMIVSALTHLSTFSQLIPYLGVFWLLVMACGYFYNGLVDAPIFWYASAALINVGAAVLCLLSPDFLAYQYYVAAIVTAWSMGNLWLFRSE